MSSLERSVRDAYEYARQTMGVRASIRTVAEWLNLSYDEVCDILVIHPE